MRGWGWGGWGGWAVRGLQSGRCDVHDISCRAQQHIRDIKKVSQPDLPLTVWSLLCFPHVTPLWLFWRLWRWKLEMKKGKKQENKFLKTEKKNFGVWNVLYLKVRECEPFEQKKKKVESFEICGENTVWKQKYFIFLLLKCSFLSLSFCFLVLISLNRQKVCKDDM